MAGLRCETSAPRAAPRLEAARPRIGYSVGRRGREYPSGLWRIRRTAKPPATRSRMLSSNRDACFAARARATRIIRAGVGQAAAAQFAEESPGSAEQGAR